MLFFSGESYQTDLIVPMRFHLDIFNCQSLTRNWSFLILFLIITKGQMLEQGLNPRRKKKKKTSLTILFHLNNIWYKTNQYNDAFVIRLMYKDRCTHYVTVYNTACVASCIWHHRIAFLWNGHDLSPKTCPRVYDHSEYFFEWHLT